MIILTMALTGIQLREGRDFVDQGFRLVLRSTETYRFPRIPLPTLHVE